uniref:Uncharacterized protein n=1 Tax=Salix viminalis TaxID=40686 RepID=A0A6N2L0V2_SALVM
MTPFIVIVNVDICFKYTRIFNLVKTRGQASLTEAYAMPLILSVEEAIIETSIRADIEKFNYERQLIKAIISGISILKTNLKEVRTLTRILIILLGTLGEILHCYLALTS